MTEIIRSLADSEKDLAYDYLCRLEETKKLVKNMFVVSELDKISIGFATK